MEEDLYVVYSKEQPHKGFLTSKDNAKYWVEAIERIGQTPEIMKILIMTVDPKGKPDLSLYN